MTLPPMVCRDLTPDLFVPVRGKRPLKSLLAPHFSTSSGDALFVAKTVAKFFCFSSVISPVAGALGKWCPPLSFARFC